MCVLCGALASDHWADEGAGRRDRALRERLLKRVLAHYGLRVDDRGVYVVRDAKGRAKVVSDIGSLWRAAEELAGQPLDPLDPALLRGLGRDG